MAGWLETFGPSGLAVTAAIFQGEAVVSPSIACAEDGGTPGRYYCAIPALSPGHYSFVFYAGGQPISQPGEFFWDGANEITPASLAAQLASLPPPDTEAIVAAILGAVAADYNAAGTIGAKINAAGAAADPWSTLIEVAPGVHVAAGLLVGKLYVSPAMPPVFPAPTPPPPPGKGKAFVYTASLPAVGEARAGIAIAASISKKPAAAGGRILEQAPLTATTDADGYAELILPASAEVSPAGTRWIFNAPDLGIANLAATLTEGQSLDLASLL